MFKSSKNKLIISENTEEMLSEFFKQLQFFDFSGCYSFLKMRKSNYNSENIEERQIYSYLVDILMNFNSCESLYYSISYIDKKISNQKKKYHQLLEKYAKTTSEFSTLKQLIDDERIRHGFSSDYLNVPQKPPKKEFNRNMLSKENSSNHKNFLTKLEDFCSQIITLCKLRVKMGSIYSDFLEENNNSNKKLKSIKERIDNLLSNLSFSHPLLFYIKTNIKFELEIFSNLLIVELSIRKHSFTNVMILLYSLRMHIQSWNNIIFLLFSKFKESHSSSSSSPSPSLSLAPNKNSSNPNYFSNKNNGNSSNNNNNNGNGNNNNSNSSSSNNNVSNSFHNYNQLSPLFLNTSSTSPVSSITSSTSSFSNYNQLIQSIFPNQNALHLSNQSHLLLGGGYSSHNNYSSLSNNSQESKKKSLLSPKSSKVECDPFSETEELNNFQFSTKNKINEKPKLILPTILPNLFRFLNSYSNNLLSIASFYFYDLLSSKHNSFLPKGFLLSSHHLFIFIIYSHHLFIYSHLFIYYLLYYLFIYIIYLFILIYLFNYYLLFIYFLPFIYSHHLFIIFVFYLFITFYLLFLSFIYYFYLLFIIFIFYLLFLSFIRSFLKFFSSNITLI